MRVGTSSATIAEPNVAPERAVIIGSEVVVDLWGGRTDEARTVPWAQNTIT